MPEKELNRLYGVSNEPFKVHFDAWQALILFVDAVWHMLPMGGYYKLNRAELKAEMEMLDIPNQKTLLSQIKWLEQGAIKELNQQREKS